MQAKMSNHNETPTAASVYRLMAPFQLQIEELPLREPAATEILCETILSAVSPGTELAAFSGAPPLRPGNVYPRLMGYCNIARVLVAGRESKIRSGEIVVTGQSHRSHFCMPANEVLTVCPSDADPLDYVTLYLYHLGYAALLTSNFVPGTSVAVVGLGALGIACVELARSMGAPVLAISARPEARAVATQLGAETHTPDAIPDGCTVDIVVTTSNAWPDWLMSLRLARRFGTVSVLGFPGRNQPPPDFNPLQSDLFYDRQLTIRAAGQVSELDVPPDQIRFNLLRNMDYLRDLASAGRIQPRRLAGDIVPARRLGELYQRLLGDRRSIPTAVLDWR